MELRHLRYLVAVAEQQSFSRAASHLHVSQSAISEQMADLEDEIGVRLLERGHRRTDLTEPGKIFLEHARRVLEMSRAAVLEAQRAERGQVGTLRIGFFAGGVGDGFPALIRNFRDTHPGVELTLMEMHVTEQWRALQDGRIDLAFTRVPEPQMRREIRFEVIQHDPMVAILPLSHPRASSKRLDVKDLSRERFVVSSRGTSPSVYDKVIELCMTAGFTPEIASVSTVWSSVILMVQSGEGVSILPYNRQQIGFRDLAFVPLKAKNAFVELCVCWTARRDRILLRNFREMAKEHVRTGRL